MPPELSRMHTGMGSFVELMILVRTKRSGRRRVLRGCARLARKPARVAVGQSGQRLGRSPLGFPIEPRWGGGREPRITWPARLRSAWRSGAPGSFDLDMGVVVMAGEPGAQALGDERVVVQEDAGDGHVRERPAPQDE